MLCEFFLKQLPLLSAPLRAQVPGLWRVCWSDLSVSSLQTPHRHGAQGEADAPL